MNFLTKFETYTDFIENRSSLILPNVALVKENDDVYITMPLPPHDYVEIAGIKWATMNIGATDITDGGTYFQWGDINGYTDEQMEYYKDNWEGYRFAESYEEGNSGDGTGAFLSKYNNTDGLTVLEPEDDAATVAWGGNWRMPTIEEWHTLLHNTTVERYVKYEDTGIYCTVLTANDDQSKKLIFPEKTPSTLYNSIDYIWSKNLALQDMGEGQTAVTSAQYCDFNDDDQYIIERYKLLFVRGILDE